MDNQDFSLVECVLKKLVEWKMDYRSLFAGAIVLRPRKIYVIGMDDE